MRRTAMRPNNRYTLVIIRCMLVGNMTPLLCGQKIIRAKQEIEIIEPDIPRALSDRLFALLALRHRDNSIAHRAM